MYQALWSASVCQLSYLHVSSTVVCQCVSAEVPAMYQVLWPASVCQLRYLPCIKYSGLPVSVSYLPCIKYFGLPMSVS